MDNIKIMSIPQIVFAHKFSADKYENRIAKADNRIEITVITSGKLDIRTDDISTAAYKDDICFNTGKCDMFVNADGPHSHHTVCFNVIFNECDNKTNLHKIPLVTRANDRSNDILIIVDDIIRTHTLYPENKLKTAGLFLQLISELDQIEDVPHGISPGEILYANKAKEYIYDHIYEPVRQNEVACHLGITPEYLCAVFKKATGTSLIRFCNEIKLDGIRTLIETKGLTLYNASAQYGYTDSNYVSRLYKKYYGVSITDAVKFQKNYKTKTD